MTVACSIRNGAWVGLAALGLFAASASALEITGVSSANLPCNGYVEVYGVGFGDTPGVLEVDGIEAPVAAWSDAEIVGYVPQGASRGEVVLRVNGAGGGSDTISVELLACGRDGRVRWQQRFDTHYLFARPVTGPDGIIYVLDLQRRLYALTPDGFVRWIVDGSEPSQIEPGSIVFGNTSVAVAPDGMIVSAHERHVTAVDSDGALLWRYDIPLERRSYLTYDTKIGPDGNVYVASCGTSNHTVGLYSLTAEGELRWSIPTIYDRTTRRQTEIVFGPGPRGDQMYFSTRGNSFAIHLDSGDVMFDNIPQVTGFQAVSPRDGTVHSPNYAYEPDGSIVWQSPVFVNGFMDMDRRGNHYVTTSLFPAGLIALDRSGNIRYRRDLDTYPSTTTVAPTQKVLLLANTASDLLVLRRKNGAEQWRMTLPDIGGRPQYWLRRPAFDESGKVAYYAAALNTAGELRKRTFLYALSLRKR